MAAEPAPRCDGVRTGRTDRRPFQYRRRQRSAGTRFRSIPALSSSIARPIQTSRPCSSISGFPTQTSDMSLAVSLRDGNLEYSGTGLQGLFAQPGNLFRPRFWSMLRDLAKFYRQATRDADLLKDETVSLGDYLRDGGYGAAFRDDHLLPMASCDLVGAAERNPVIPGCDLHSLPSTITACCSLRSARPGKPWSAAASSYVQRLIQPVRRLDQARHQSRHGAAHRGRRHRDGLVRRIGPIRSCRHGRHMPIRHLSALADPTSDETRTARRIPLQPQPRRTALGRELHAPASRGLVELELYRLTRCDPPTASASPTG